MKKKWLFKLIFFNFKFSKFSQFICRTTTSSNWMAMKRWTPVVFVCSTLVEIVLAHFHQSWRKHFRSWKRCHLPGTRSLNFHSHIWTRRKCVNTSNTSYTRRFNCECPRQARENGDGSTDENLVVVVGSRYATESWVLENLHRIVDAGEIICVENLTQAVKVEIWIVFKF